MRTSLRSAIVGSLLFAVSGGTAFATGGEFGDECVMGLALGKDIKTDCSVNTVYNGKIYCFGNRLRIPTGRCLRRSQRRASAA